jgi:acetyltransferase-like isoleucine patch superfamily enzyme
MKVVLYGPKNPETIRFFIHLNAHEARNGLEKSELVGFLHGDPALKGKEFHGLPIFGGLDEVPRLAAEGVKFVSLVTGSTVQRYRTARGIVARGGELTSIVHPDCDLLMARVGPGAYIQEKVAIQANVRFGSNCSVHMGCLIAHDVSVGHSSFISFAVAVSGEVEIGDGVFVGANATLVPRIKVGKFATVGAGAMTSSLFMPRPRRSAVPAPPSPLRGGAGGGGRLYTIGEVVERLEELAAAMIEGTAPPAGPASAAVLAAIEAVMRPRLRASGPAEVRALLDGLDGKFVRPGPSGAPSRGRLDVLPTGRNFYSVDNRAIPTPTAWELGRKSAEGLLVRHFQDNGVHLRSLALSVWGTSNMRTGGDDIAQALAFIGAKPVWDPSSLRLSGYEIVPLAKLGRPRVDVTLRISGLFRDAFPQQIALFDKAIRAIGALDEPESENPIAARMRSDALGLMREGKSEAEAALAAGHRVFGSKPGAYGAGLQALIDSGMWERKADLGRAFLNWGQYAYGAHAAGTPELARFAARLGDIEAVVHNQDNREHDLLDSDDYYQFEGGLVATAESLTGHRPLAYHNDHSRPERPVARTLEEEVSRVVRSRVVNPKWIDGVKRHGYKGAFEIIATVDYMFAFAATTGAVKTHHFDLAFEAYVEDEATRNFIRANNRFGYDELIAKFNEARRRGYWVPRSNSAFDHLTKAHSSAFPAPST